MNFRLARRKKWQNSAPLCHYRWNDRFLSDRERAHQFRPLGLWREASAGTPAARGETVQRHHSLADRHCLELALFERVGIERVLRVGLRVEPTALSNAIVDIAP